MTDPVLELKDVSKDYHSLRPLRVADLSVAPGEQVALLGFDQMTAELFVNLVTGASLPDRGSVRLFGRATSEIADSADWLAVVDRFGIVSRRAVLLDALTVVQNLAMPFTLALDPPPSDVRERAIALAREVGLPADVLDRPIAELSPAAVVALRLARALALDPAIVVFEHPTADVARDEVAGLARLSRNTLSSRKIAGVTLTADREFANASARRVLTLQPASGRLTTDGWLARFRRA